MERMRKKAKKKVVITSLPRWSYYNWFLLGFYELERNGEIDFRLEVSFWSKLSTLKLPNIVYKILNKFHEKFDEDSYNLEGYISYENGSKKLFCIDCADSPFLFDSELLREKDCYFKMQCPINLDAEGFELAPDVRIPWMDHAHAGQELSMETNIDNNVCKNVHQYKYKIKPLMVGPRRLSAGNNYYALKKQYKKYLEARTIKKQKKLMCYFGSAKGPKVIENQSDPNFDNEASLMGWFKEKLNHPNEKRALVANMIYSLGEGYDARVINLGNFGEKKMLVKKNVIALEDFCEHVAKFEYNCNVSGFRLSIPNRFVESFMVGTAIVTDQLSVRWYASFDDEVKETVKMGYLPLEMVDWDQFENDIKNLPKVDAQCVIDAYERKWSPIAVCNYIMCTVSEGE